MFYLLTQFMVIALHVIYRLQLGGQQLLVLQIPMTSDLRLILSIFKMVKVKG